MNQVTELMDKIFSDSTPMEYKDGVQAAIEDAWTYGQAVYSEFDETLFFASVGDDVVIEDKSNGECTIATKESDGSFHLTSGVHESSTQPNVAVPRIKGKDGVPLKGSQPNVVSNMDAAITDEDKSGTGKAFSVVMDFDSEEEAQAYFSEVEELQDTVELYSDALDELSEASLTFSDDEVANISFSATELQQDVERLAGTGDLQLAFSIMEDAEEVRAYSVMASNAGHDLSEVIEACNAYSAYATEMAEDIIAETPITEYFSDFNEEELDAFFSDCDEIEQEVLFSILEEGDDTLTFSDAECLVEDYRGQLELETPMVNVFSDMSEDELDTFFSDFTEVEEDALFSAMEEDETLTFSDANEILDNLHTPLVEMFSDYSEEDFQDMFSDMESWETTLFSDMIGADENYTFSDYLEASEEMREFSDEEAEILADNMNALYSAHEDMLMTGDVDLACDLYELAGRTFSDLERAEQAGHEVEEAKTACAKFADNAEKVASDPVAQYKTEVDKALEDGTITDDERKELDKLREEIELDKATAEKIEAEAKAKSTPTLPAVETKKASDSYEGLFSDYSEDNRTFSSVQNSSCNPFLTTPI